MSPAPQRTFLSDLTLCNRWDFPLGWCFRRPNLPTPSAEETPLPPLLPLVFFPECGTKARVCPFGPEAQDPRRMLTGLLLADAGGGRPPRRDWMGVQLAGGPRSSECPQHSAEAHRWPSAQLCKKRHPGVGKRSEVIVDRPLLRFVPAVLLRDVCQVPGNRVQPDASGAQAFGPGHQASERATLQEDGRRRLQPGRR